MKVIYLTALLVFLNAYYAISQSNTIFEKGSKAANQHHVGNVWLNELTKSDTILNCHITVATFDSAARLDWHNHPGGQILLITDGIGYYQEKGGKKQVVKKGDVIKCLPDIEHWHGATEHTSFTYIAVNTNPKNGKTIWGRKVTDEEYYENLKIATFNTPELELTQLSKMKWKWMSDRKVDSLRTLFHDKAVFVHMGATFSKKQELDVIQSGSIQYKQADILESSLQLIGNTAIVLNKIKLVAVVGGNEVTNPFTVTEVYIKENEKWVLGSMSFTKLITQ